MARATETGFYFEPLTERLALVVEGAPFPTAEQWAYVGDPIEMTPELARLQCALRWPGVDPDEIHVELDLGLNAMLAELERTSKEENAAPPLQPPAPADVADLLAQAEELQRQLDQLGPAGSITAEELAARVEELALARAAEAISGAARANRANRELEESLAEELAARARLLGK
jgi:hypothetical protein